MTTGYSRGADFGSAPRKGKQPSKALRKQVVEAFDADALKHLCTTWDFSDYAHRVQLAPSRTGRDRFYWHQDNGSNVLAVAHLDSVQHNSKCTVVETASGLLATSGALDDRLGVYVILDLLPKLGITCDVLLTTDEEMAASTAEDFETTKSYNWMFSFDRGGTDVVAYQYDTPDLVDRIEACGAQHGIGSYSDICALDFLGCAGVNWGVGYEDYHSSRSHAWLDDTFRMVARFVKFYRQNADIHIPYEEPDYRTPRDDWEWEDGDRKMTDDEMVADCGHLIDISDPTTYLECAGGSYVLCHDCGTPRDWQYDPDDDDF